jgi:hypothetical protein
MLTGLSLIVLLSVGGTLSRPFVAFWLVTGTLHLWHWADAAFVLRHLGVPRMAVRVQRRRWKAAVAADGRQRRGHAVVDGDRMRVGVWTGTRYNVPLAGLAPVPGTTSTYEARVSWSPFLQMGDTVRVTLPPGRPLPAPAPP